MKRWIWNIICGLSLLLCIATVGMWVRSYWYADCLENSKYDIGWKINSCCGVVIFEYTSSSFPIPYIGGWVLESRPIHAGEIGVSYDFAGTRWHFLGISSGISRSEDYNGAIVISYATYFLVVPSWLICLATVVLPTIWLIRRLKSGANQVGLCDHCGYDLRASKTRCPECGTAITAGTKA